jgi:hypothetical protein
MPDCFPKRVNAVTLHDTFSPSLQPDDRNQAAIVSLAQMGGPAI